MFGQQRLVGVGGTPDGSGAIAHLLRATGYGVHPGQVETWTNEGLDRCLDWVIGDEGQSMPIAGEGELAVHSADECAAGVTQRYYPLAPWWFGRMLRPEARLHEKICLFWHSHFASSQRVAEAEAMVHQHRTIRAHALGNFRAFARDMLVDPAMLQWLDGDSSVAGSPNENLARFLGAGARRLEAADLADAICDHPGTADFVTRRLFRFFVGTDPADARAAQLADGFRATGLEIRPLVQGILTSPEFGATRFGRARWPVVWTAAAHVAIGASDRIGGEDLAADLGQELASPKLVNGWALDDRWIESGAWARKARWVTHRLRYAVSQQGDRLRPGNSAEEVLRHVGVWEPTPDSLAAVTAAWGGAHTRWGDAERTADAALEMALLTPEFAMV